MTALSKTFKKQMLKRLVESGADSYISEIILDILEDEHKAEIEKAIKKFSDAIKESETVRYIEKTYSLKQKGEEE